MASTLKEGFRSDHWNFSSPELHHTATKNPFDDPVGNPFDDPAENPFDDPVENPFDDPVENPFDDPVDDPFQDHVENAFEGRIVQSPMMSPHSKEVIRPKRSTFPGLAPRHYAFEDQRVESYTMSSNSEEKLHFGRETFLSSEPRHSAFETSGFGIADIEQYEPLNPDPKSPKHALRFCFTEESYACPTARWLWKKARKVAHRAKVRVKAKLKRRPKYMQIKDSHEKDPFTDN
ncbi:hypothetical protein K490DRAFT_53574 [Saccharata proteae CBS 121410]|uniref:Uncharacterized protein n=1 Tax=Saccharata proteae CBS 121410 TaxID=1314787 RepID=A0A9P4I115_9PEZI|nr:hypothetical protein K490DRAFT_53574 [Saccharata proteae CBS 121410]